MEDQGCYSKVEQLHLVITGIPYEDCQNIEKICYSEQETKEFMEDFMKNSATLNQIWVRNKFNKYKLEYENNHGTYLTTCTYDVDRLYTKKCEEK